MITDPIFIAKHFIRYGREIYHVDDDQWLDAVSSSI